MEFTRMTGGGWVISRWSIRMPVLERAPASRSFRSRDLDDPAPHVVELHVAGGTLTTVVAGTDTLWSRPPVTFEGIVLDSLSHAVVAKSRVTLAGTNLTAVSDERGRFSISGVLPGGYTAEVRTPALDSLNAVHVLAIALSDSTAALEIRVPDPAQVETALCGTTHRNEPGIVTGNVQMPVGDSLPANARVEATWMVAHLITGAGGMPVELRERRSLQARVMPDGAFRLCGVPVNTELSIAATGADAESPEPEAVRIPRSMRYAQTDVGLARLPAGRAVLSGTVLIDSTTQPVASAEVMLPDLGLVVRSSESGSFRLGEIPAGVHRVVVRRLGLVSLETVLTFGSGEHVERRFAMARAAVLDSMRVVADATPRAMLTFEEHRKLGLGHFLTRADLAKADGQTMGAVLRSLSGVRLLPGTSTQLWAASARNRATARTVDRADRLAGARRDCYATVYLNNATVYAGRNEEPLFDVNTIRPDQLEAVEYYAGAAETPLEYGTLDSTCGVLVLWTRRTP
jgi:CarboxypepD_reg-like domain